MSLLPVPEPIDVAALEPRLRLVARRFAAAAEVDDLVQEALIVVLEAVRTGRVPALEVAPFAVGVVKNLARADVRRTARRSALVRGAPEREPLPTPADRLDGRRLAEHLRRLPWREMDVLVRSYAQDEDASAIASDLGTTEGNVRVLRHRALAHLRALFFPRGGP